MNRAELKQTVYKVIRDIVDNPDAVIQDNTFLGSEGLGIDSVGFLEIVLELESRTGISIRDEQLTAESLATAGSLIGLLEKS
ncbi:MAG: acyl carrier protein [Bacteroidales bacterium]|jgi:acyl carrier protein